MELSSKLDEVDLFDLMWAVRNRYETDVKWVVMNVVSILSNKNPYKLQNNKADFRDITGVSLYCPTSIPACNWSGSYEDVILVSSIISGVNKFIIERELYSIVKRDYEELSIRLRRFVNAKKNPIYGESIYLKRDESGNFYMWDYNSNGKLSQIPESLMKHKLLLWETHNDPSF